MDSKLEDLLKLLPDQPQKGLNLSDPLELQAYLKNQLAAGKPVTAEEYLAKLKENRLELDSEGGLAIEPSKEFVIKTFERTTRSKIFINVTSHPIVEEPHEAHLVEEAVRLLGKARISNTHVRWRSGGIYG